MQETFLAWQAAMNHWGISRAVRDVVWVKAVLESAHIAAMGLVLFAVGMMALRLAGFASRGGSLTEMVRRFSPWVWSALVIVVVTGIVLLTGAGNRRGLPTPMFQFKMIVMLLAILVTAGLQVSLQADASFWELSPARRISAKVLAPICLLLWMITVCAGRWLAYGYVLFPNG